MADSTVGVGTVIGSAPFNVCCITAGAVFAVSGSLVLDPWLMARELSSLLIVLVLVLIFLDDYLVEVGSGQGSSAHWAPRPSHAATRKALSTPHAIPARLPTPLPIVLLPHASHSHASLFQLSLLRLPSLHLQTWEAVVMVLFYVLYYVPLLANFEKVKRFLLRCSMRCCCMGDTGGGHGNEFELEEAGSKPLATV